MLDVAVVELVVVHQARSKGLEKYVRNHASSVVNYDLYVEYTSYMYKNMYTI